AAQGATYGGTQLALAGIEVALTPALSPCQPLSSCMSNAANESAGSATLPPRLGTSCHITPLLVPVGLRMRKLAMYSTLPLAFLGASSISVMFRLLWCRGSSSPNARPVSSSYGWPLMAVVVSTTILVTRASDCGAQASATAAATPAKAGLRKSCDFMLPPLFNAEKFSRRPGRRPCAPGTRAVAVPRAECRPQAAGRPCRPQAASAGSLRSERPRTGTSGLSPYG